MAPIAELLVANPLNEAWSCSRAEDEDEEDVFQPQLGNVIFASAHDGWAFRPAQFAAMYAAKLGCNPTALVKVGSKHYILSSIFDLIDPPSQK